MEQVRIIDLLIMAISALLGWWGKVMWGMVTTLRSDHTNLSARLPEFYLSKTEYERREDRVVDEIRLLRTELSKQFDDLWREMRSKVDKP